MGFQKYIQKKEPQVLVHGDKLCQSADGSLTSDTSWLRTLRERVLKAEFLQCLLDSRVVGPGSEPSHMIFHFVKAIFLHLTQACFGKCILINSFVYMLRGKA